LKLPNPKGRERLIAFAELVMRRDF
jgi:hypothetical protein